MVKVKQPEGNSWKMLLDDVEAALKFFDKHLHWRKKNYKHGRGKHASFAAGTSFGGGQPVSLCTHRICHVMQGL